jgi:hypothetical protein
MLLRRRAFSSTRSWLLERAAGASGRHQAIACATLANIVVMVMMAELLMMMMMAHGVMATARSSAHSALSKADRDHEHQCDCGKQERLEHDYCPPVRVSETVTN